MSSRKHSKYSKTGPSAVPCSILIANRVYPDEVGKGASHLEAQAGHHTAQESGRGQGVLGP